MALRERWPRSMWVCLLLTAFGAGELQAAGGGSLYRFRDEAGRLHVESSLPPNYAQAGYEVLDRQTLKVRYRVDAALSDEQRAQKARLEQDAAAAKAAAQQAETALAQKRMDLQNRDRMLLQTYASSADIERLRDSKLESLGLILRAMENTIGHLRLNLGQMDGTLAEHKAAGRAPPATLVRARAQTVTDLANQEQAVTRLLEEQSALRARFDADLERYRHLTGAAMSTESLIKAQPKVSLAGDPRRLRP